MTWQPVYLLVFCKGLVNINSRVVGIEKTWLTSEDMGWSPSLIFQCVCVYRKIT